MTIPGHRRLALAIAIAGSLSMGAARAQEAAGAAQEPYVDRIISPQQLQPLPPEDDETADDTGLPRSFRIEAVASRNEYGDDSFDEQGLSIGGFRETASWGAFSLDATVFHSDRRRFNGLGANDGDIGGLATLWQRNLYLGNGWRVDNGLGVLNTPAPPLQRSQYRFFLPTVAFAGASSEWHSAGNGLLLQGGFGRAGVYTGTRVVGFDVADGNVAALGAQWQWAPQWTGAASFLGTHGRIVPDDLGEPVFEPGDTQALYAAAAWQGERDRAQFNVLGSDGDPGSATGAWIDIDSVRGRYRHNFGAYRLGQGLAWGALPINNDVEGGYYRIGYQYGRWNWNAGLDGIHSLSGDGFDGLYASGYVRYQASSTLGYGGSLNLRDAMDTSHSLQLFLDKQTGWGQTRVQVDEASSGGRSDSWQVSLDQAFPLRQGTRLSASIAHGSLHYDDDIDATTTTTLALYGGRELTDRLTVDGSARWTHGNGSEAFRGTDLNIGLNWRVTPRWSLSAAFYQSRGSRRSPFILDPLVTGTPFISLPRNRSVFLTLRYELSAGRPQGVIGGAPGGPTGTVAGSLFLDDNGDGVRGASEQAAANVTVLLDGRFAVRTDSLGNFEFPRVAAGSHTLTVVPDNLPLPWFVAPGDAQRTVQVRVRQATRVDIGARRQP
ncbi:carboxypeptidase-like regulatory domain-containing protein [Luteimonas soli]|uniref:Carboxypeptidase-like regulatory domain-containing protein n=1 Tax=Luteimonas soli TaxID=1648966 RepID=A0ABV7XM57_9GAMM